MPDAADPRLVAWGNYYVIVGSSGAALIGLQFVVITLISGMRRRATLEAIHAFGTPTVVHLAGALVVSAIMSAPWSSLPRASIAVSLCGLGGLSYGAIVIRRARRQTDYKPVREDWLWYVILPLGIYAVLTAAGLALRASALSALFVIGAAALGLLLLAIRNAWDTVTHMVISSHENEAGRE